MSIRDVRMQTGFPQKTHESWNLSEKEHEQMFSAFQKALPTTNTNLVCSTI